MNHPTQSSHRNGKTFIAGLLAYVLLTSQLTPMALAFNGSAVRTTSCQDCGDHPLAPEGSGGN